MKESIQEFLKNHLCYFDLDKTYFIMSGVKDFAATADAFAMVKHAYLAYPGEETSVKGINREEILESVRRFRLQQDIDDLLIKLGKDNRKDR